MFAEPDLVRAKEIVPTAHGMTLDAISASAIRHVVTGVGKMPTGKKAARGKRCCEPADLRAFA